MNSEDYKVLETARLNRLENGVAESRYEDAPNPQCWQG